MGHPPKEPVSWTSSPTPTKEGLLLGRLRKGNGGRHILSLPHSHRCASCLGMIWGKHRSKEGRKRNNMGRTTLFR